MSNFDTQLSLKTEWENSDVRKSCKNGIMGLIQSREMETGIFQASSEASMISG